ncbi:hypothetical protein X777_02836 [Ooceraea biroi]|uniref:Uncharacterized protein n=1 Tax=Ooceraea biroi TaxID=2015173 RepID=A0A026WJT0_OOCBI|nr:hypothetical protein X777_02836 [Ooceraea biroi]
MRRLEPAAATAAEEEMLLWLRGPRVVWSPRMHSGCRLCGVLKILIDILQGGLSILTTHSGRKGSVSGQKSTDSPIFNRFEKVVFNLLVMSSSTTITANFSR